MSRFTWSRSKPTGCIMLPETYTLRRGGVSYAIIQKGPSGWFGYGIGDGPRYNTHAEQTTMEAAKADAIARVRAALKERAE